MTLWTVARQAPPSTGFSGEEFWGGLPFPSLGDLPRPGVAPGSPAAQVASLPPEPPGQPLFKWAAVKRCRSVCGGLLQLLPCLWVQHPAPHICAFSFLFLASLAGSLSVVPPKRSLKISRNPCLPLRSIRDCCCVCGGRCLGASAPGPSVPPASSPPSRRLRCWQACSALLLPRGPALLRVLEVVMAGAAGSRVADRHRQSWAWLPRFLVLGSRAQTPR